MFLRPGPKKVFTPFIHLALIVAKRQITQQWKSQNALRWEGWKEELIKWARAEGTALHREMERGLRKPETPQAWDVILLALEMDSELMAEETEENVSGPEPAGGQTEE